MRKSRFTETQIIGILKTVEAGRLPHLKLHKKHIFLLVLLSERFMNALLPIDNQNRAGGGVIYFSGTLPD